MDVVTGAFGYIGRYIARRLLAQGREVRTITTHPEKPNPFGNRVKAFSYNFEAPQALVETLRGAETLFNTYWIRFPYEGHTYEQALENTHTLFRCAQQAGVGRIVQISVTRASPESDLPYYRGKAAQEAMLKECGAPFSIVRPTLVFGEEDILVNNIAWLMRKSPLFPVFGAGEYRVMPVFVEDLAQIAVGEAGQAPGRTVDAIGPETYTFRELLECMRAKLHLHTRLVSIPPGLGIFAGQVLSLLLRDVLLTRNELKGLMDEMLTSEQAPNGTTKFSDWLETNRENVGMAYSSEVKRHFHWKAR